MATPATPASQGAAAPVQPQTRRAHGGVSPRPNAPAIEGAKTLVQPRGQAPAAVAFPGFVYQGGPVIGCPQVYASYWGSLWTSDPAHQAEAGRLNQFLTDILASQFMNVLSQYGVGAGAGAAGAFVRASFVSNVPATLTDDGIHSIIQSCIDAGVLPEPTNPSNNALIIYLDDNTGVEDPANGLVLCEPANDTAFGYHYFFTTTAGNPFYYAIIPYLNDACLTESCPGDDAGCSLHLSETPEQRKTQVTSHEFAEMTTDPQLNAWVDPVNGENGDICNGESDSITVGSNTWTVQRIYSKYDDTQSNGAIFCLAQAPSPEPRLSPGPAARPLTLAARQPLASFERLLPLPAVRFDAQTKQMTMDDLEVRRYVQKLCHPLHHSQLVPDLPGLLRQAADSLSKK